MAKSRTHRPSVDNIPAPLSLHEIGAIRPTFIRLPEPGVRCPYTNLSRTVLENLCQRRKANAYRPKVRSVRLTMPNSKAKRGARLIDYESLIAYINGCDSMAA